MNPLKWSLAQKIALAIFAIVGGAFGLIFGYIADALTKGASGGTRFSYYLSDLGFYGGTGWTIFGLVAGGALAYASMLARR